MAEVLSRLDARRVYGSVSAMIPDVSSTESPLIRLTNIDTPLAMRRVLHLKMVTQCAMLEDFGIFLVLADKVRPLLSIG